MSYCLEAFGSYVIDGAFGVWVLWFVNMLVCPVLVLWWYNIAV
jgi:hypothetical protein